MKISTWYNCYDETLKAFITPESFAHPAKMALNLTRRIFEYGEAQGYWRPGDLIADPFGGIGTTGLVGSYAGYRVIMCELEPRFVALNQANIDRNSPNLLRLGRPLPVVVQGDSRRLGFYLEVGKAILWARDYNAGINAIEDQSQNGVAQAIGVVTSPPFSPPGNQPVIGQGTRSQMAGDGRVPLDNQQGQTAGNIADLRIEDIESVIGAVTSPPWSDTLSSDVVDKDARRQFAREHGISNAEHVSPVDMERIGARDQTYGDSDGQIGTLNGEDFDRIVGVLTSPPYADSVNQSDVANDSAARLERKANSGVDVTRAVKRGGPNSVLNQPQVYGNVSGQIGSLKDDAGKETYWSAMAQVYAQLYQVLKPGGVASIVVKDYVRNKARVPLCDQTAKLLEAVGFTVIERTHAMLTKETPLGLDMFTNEHVTRTTSRKSFFRRLAEKKGSPAIDFEEVIWARKPGACEEREIERVDGIVTSPPYADSVNGGEGPGARYDFKTHSPQNAIKQTSESEYGTTIGQIGALSGGELDHIISTINGEA